MARLPKPGSDEGKWGDVLNDFLSQSHKVDGTLKDASVTANVLAPGAVTSAKLPDGTIAEVKLDPSVRAKLNATSSIGATGPVGPGGSAGAIGATGAAGPAGTPGGVGATGATGATGPAGTDGSSVQVRGSVANAAALPTGLGANDVGDGYITDSDGHLHVWSGSSWSDVGVIRGPAGAVGATGSTGPTGATGPMGTAGTTGATGPQGASGTPGAVGATGPAGTTEWSGITGKPAVIASGVNAAAARASIGAASATGISLDATVDAADRLAMTQSERTKIANLTGAVYITTTGAALPSDLAEGTLIARYSASGPATPVVTNVGSATSAVGSTTLTVTTTASIPANDVIAVAVNKGSATAGQLMGSATVTLSSGAVSGWTRASANRELTHDTALLVARVSTSIPSGSTVTITTSTNGTYRSAAIIAGIHNVSSGTPDASSGDDAAGQDRSTSHGANVNNGASLAATTDAATTVPHTLVLGAFGIGGSAVFTHSTGQTEVDQQMTSAGSSDRGVTLGYKVVSTTGIQTMTINSSPSSSMAGVIVALPLEILEV